MKLYCLLATIGSCFNLWKRQPGQELTTTAAIIPLHEGHNCSPEYIIGNTLNSKYQVESVLGTGQNAVVFKASWNSQQFALKCLKNANSTSNFELYLLHNLNHPHITKLLDYFIQSNNLFLVMEVYEMDLDKFITEYSYYPKRVFLQILKTVIYLHNRHIYHRDIKGENILLKRQGGSFIAVLADFGLAWMDSELSGDSSVMTGYILMSPEIYDGIPGSSWAKNDVWTLGKLLLHLMAKNPYYNDPSTTLDNVYELNKTHHFSNELMNVFTKVFDVEERRPTAIQLWHLVVDTIADELIRA